MFELSLYFSEEVVFFIFSLSAFLTILSIYFLSHYILQRKKTIPKVESKLGFEFEHVRKINIIKIVISLLVFIISISMCLSSLNIITIFNDYNISYKELTKETISVSFDIETSDLAMFYNDELIVKEIKEKNITSLQIPVIKDDGILGLFQYYSNISYLHKVNDEKSTLEKISEKTSTKRIITHKETGEELSGFNLFMFKCFYNDYKNKIKEISNDKVSRVNINIAEKDRDRVRRWEYN